MTPLNLINHLRLVPLSELRSKLEKLQSRHPDHFEIVENFIVSCEPRKVEPATDP